MQHIFELIRDGGIFYCSHSGGKDSQAMAHYLSLVVPNDQLVFVHANLGEVEWEGVINHIKANINKDLNVVQAGKTFLEMVERRGMWPSSAHRQCTSDLKRGPIMKFIRNDLAKRGGTIAVNCMGLRAEESTARAKKTVFEVNKNETRTKRVNRTVYNWLPIFHWTENTVYDVIYEIGQKPFWAYGERGELNSRLSCVFCIMGSKNDLAHGARENPELFKKYVELEKAINHTMFMAKKQPIGLEEYIGVSVVDSLICKLSI